MAEMSGDLLRTQLHEPAKAETLIYRQSAWTRLTHWIWAVALFFLLLSGLQIFNAHPTLYIGDQSGFAFDNEVLAIGAENTPEGPVGYTRVWGARFDTSGVLGLSWIGETPVGRGFPAWATIPSTQDLATGRLVHFFFAWILSGTLLVWLVASLVNGHLRRDLAPRLDDLKRLPSDIAANARLKFHHRREYNTLQKMAYGGVLFVLLPLMILTGLAMSPGRRFRSSSRGTRSRRRWPLIRLAASQTRSVPDKIQAKKKWTTRPVARSCVEGMVAHAGKPRPTGVSPTQDRPSTPLVSKRVPNTRV